MASGAGRAPSLSARPARSPPSFHRSGPRARFHVRTTRVPRRAMTPLKQLAEQGQSVWIDYLSRPFVQDGDLAGLIDDGVVGVTSNPTIFQGAIAEGDAYDDQIREILDSGESEPKEIFIRLAADDIRNACDILRDVYDSGNGKDGYVSLEVDPNLAHDTEGTIEEAKRLHALIDKPNLFINIPATKE